GAAKELRQVALRSSRHGQAVVGSGYVRAQRSRTPRELGSGESTGRNVDAFEVDGQRTLHLLVVDLRGLLGSWGGCLAGTDARLNRSSAESGHLLRRVRLRGSGRALVGGADRGLLSPLPLLLMLQLFSELLNLQLLRGQGVFQCLDIRGGDGRRSRRSGRRFFCR